MSRIFLLSPARVGGRRAQLLLREGAACELARRVQIRDATLGEVFSFCSGLYFRGKITYATKFAQPPEGIAGVQVITPTRGLLPAQASVGTRDLEEFGAVDIAGSEPRFTAPLIADLEKLAANKKVEFVLLGSIATGKYADCLLPVLGDRLLFPDEFVGRGDMSRGGLLLRHAASGEELKYIRVAGAIRRGSRPARLPPKQR